MSQFNPFSAALDAQRTLLEAGTESLEKSTVAGDRIARMQEVEVGQTPSEVVYRENKMELLHYEAQTEEQSEMPILVVYALINRPYILDLQPDRSVVRRLLEAGHDVYLIDWNEPSRLDQHLTLADYINRYIDNCVDVVAERSGQDAINVLGYCMGGTMAAIYAALNPEKVNALGLMAAGLCFDDSAGTLELWGDSDFYDPDDVTETFGNMPGEMLDIGFALMDPVDNYVSKYVRLYDNLENEDFVENFGRMEKWLSEGIDVAGNAYVEFLEDLYQDNKLYRNEFVLDGEPVDVENIDMPILQILGEYDHLIPADASRPFNDVVGSDDVATIEYPTGHIGLSVSGSSHEDVWPQVAEWFHDRTPSEPVEEETAEPAEMGEADPAATEGSDLEELEGLGPTYAERLREAGIESIVDLAEADIAAIVDAAEIPESRAREWVATARVNVATDLEAEDASTTNEVLEERVEEDVREEPAEPGEMEVDEAVADEVTDEDLGSQDSTDLEDIDGIGPAYAERLREAGIESIADLAGSDPTAVAEAAQVGESRAREWVEQSRS